MDVNAESFLKVSVRALRGGRLAMEDEFIVVGGGRLSAVFDGHGGGGVSQYLRDRLHVIISEKLHQQEKSLKSKGKFRGDLKRFWKRGDDSTECNALSGCYLKLGNAPGYCLSNEIYVVWIDY